MRKAVVIIAAVAILGLLALFNSKHSTTGPATAASTSQSPPAPASTSASTQSTPAAPVAGYKDGIFTGSTQYNPYGPVQVAAVISGGKITDIKFLQMPSVERESQQRTSFAEPYLKDSAISKQSAHIDFVSGATDTSQSFEQSLQAALNQAASS